MVFRLPRLLSVLVVVVVLLRLGVATPARAADGDATAVLGLEAIDGQDNAIANEITEALRQRVAATKGTQLVPGKDLVEIKLVFSCSDDTPGCLAQAAKSLGATKLIYGNVKHVGTDYIVSLKQLDAGRGVVESSTVETIPRRKSEPAALRASSSQWLSRLGGGGAVAAGAGSLVVRSNVAGAVVTIDGAEVGLTAKKPLMVADVAPGKHEIRVDKAGYASMRQQFTMGTQALPLTVTLRGNGAEGDEREPEGTVTRRPATGAGDDVPGDDSGRSWARTGFWIGAGVAVISLAIATKYALDIRGINSDLDQFRDVPSANLSPNDKATIHNKLSQGDKAETRQWIFVGVGSAFAVAGGFLLYKGYLDKESGSGPATTDNHGLRVFPTANASSGGIAAEFDF